MSSLRALLRALPCRDLTAYWGTAPSTAELLLPSGGKPPLAAELASLFREPAAIVMCYDLSDASNSEQNMSAMSH